MNKMYPYLNYRISRLWVNFALHYTFWYYYYIYCWMLSFPEKKTFTHTISLCVIYIRSIVCRFWDHTLTLLRPVLINWTWLSKSTVSIEILKFEPYENLSLSLVQFITTSLTSWYPRPRAGYNSRLRDGVTSQWWKFDEDLTFGVYVKI